MNITRLHYRANKLTTSEFMASPKVTLNGLVCSSHDPICTYMPEKPLPDEDTYNKESSKSRKPSKSTTQPPKANKAKTRMERIASAHEETVASHGDISKKIKDSKTRKTSWNPQQIAANRWSRLSPEEQRGLKSKANQWLFTGATKTREWLVWNVPTLSYKLACLIFNYDISDTFLDAYQIAGVTKGLDKIKTDKCIYYEA